eukprot:CAMPEP_0197003554 /NCGR_PEP_ID=MMETSP1380-20130617/8451_1 /TAXON_ID=5936 /ORGANISM="Euplotes crassus, Strain CT5" /LENGTH=78 /DNA_ID=CAMNT_0042422091 /DNA_START=14 /DNA_END=250 /DNA_ORIENTATION=+
MNAGRKQLVNLIRARAALASEIQDYNFRHYFVRRATEDLSTVESDTAYKISDEMIGSAEKDVKQMERIKTVQNSIYIV